MSRDELRASVGDLIEWASALTRGSIPDAVMKRAALVLLDDIGAAAASIDEPEIQGLCARLGSDRGNAQVFVRAYARAEPRTAAFVNAIAANWCQLDEGHRDVMCHAGLYTMPAICAEAEAHGQTIGDVLHALVVGYELVCRFAKAFRFSTPTAHPHALWSALGAAAGLAALRQLAASEFRKSLETAITFALSGPFSHGRDGALVQNAWAGVGITCGFLAHDLRACAIAGIASSFRDTLCGTFGATEEPKWLLADLGKRWELLGGYHKLYASAQQSHAAVEAALAIHDKMKSAGRNASEIAHVEIDIHELGLAMNNLEPTNILAAQFSIPHVVAAALKTGTCDSRSVGTVGLCDPVVGKVRARTAMRLFTPRLPPPHERAARVQVELRDGTSYREDCLAATGGPSNPYSPAAIFKKASDALSKEFPGFAANGQLLLDLDRACLNASWKDQLEGWKTVG